MIALINQEVYNLKDYYLESDSTRLHLIIANDSYDLDNLEANIKASEDIKVYDASLEEEPRDKFVDYTLIRSLTKNYADANEIHVTVDVANYQSLISALSAEVGMMKIDLKNAQNGVNNAYQLAQEVNTRLNNFSVTLSELADRITALENNPVEE